MLLMRAVYPNANGLTNAEKYVQMVSDAFMHRQLPTNRRREL